MAQQKIPNVTLHRRSLANASKIVRANFVNAGIAGAETIPIMSPYHHSISNFAKICGELLGEPLPNARFYISDINSMLQAIEENLSEITQPPSEPPVFIGPDIPDVQFIENELITDIDYSVYFTGEGYYQLSLTPASLTFNSSTAVLAGVTTRDGVHTQTLTLINSEGSAESNEFVMTILAASAPPLFDGTISDISTEADVPMTPYDASVHFQTGGAVVTYTLENKPIGFVIDSATGVITGTSSTPASFFAATVTGTNADGSAVSNEFGIEILPASVEAPLFTGTVANSMGNTTSTPIIPIDFGANFTTGGPVDSYTVDTPFPAGLTMDSATGIVSGTGISTVGETTVNVVTGINEGGSDVSNPVTVEIVPNPVGAGSIDMDGDGKPDTMIGSVSHDEDSINIDTTGDDVADVIVPK